MTSLQDKTALITGASSGIGKALALALAAAGTRLILLGRNSARLELVASEARALGAEVEIHLVDLTDDEQLTAFIKAFSQARQSVDILIHSAGVISLGPVASAAIAELDWHYRLNLRVPYLLTQALLPLLKSSRGQVVFINSGAGLNAKANWSQYAISKHGLKALADSLREELKADRVRVLSVYPGRTASPMQAEVHRMEGKSYEAEKFIQPQDLAQQVLSALALAPTAAVTELIIRPGLD